MINLGLCRFGIGFFCVQNLKEMQHASNRNDRFSGHLPVLSKTDSNLKRLYDMSVMALLLHKRTRRMGTPAKAYATGMPGWTHCFLWDTQMTAIATALLDPTTLKNMIEFWIHNDPTSFFATDYVTDEPEGVWYAINDFAMSYIMYAYLSVTGNFEWLNHKIDGKTILDYYIKFSTRFLERIEDDYLVNYGELRNLLECVFSYAYKVPSFNATNVWSLRKLSELLEKLGRCEEADAYREKRCELQKVFYLYMKKAKAIGIVNIRKVRGFPYGRAWISTTYF
jgi:hypothetical protein